MSQRNTGALWSGLVWLVPVCMVGGWAIYEGQRLARADLMSVGTRKQVDTWASGAAVPGSQQEWDAAMTTLTAAQAITPDNPGLQESIADLYTVAGRRDWADPPKRLQHFNQAVTHYRLALALRAADPQTWASLAAAYQGQGDTGNNLHRAWDKALELGPNEGHVQPMLLETALATWTTASPKMQRWTMDFFEKSAEPQRKAINEMARRYKLRFDVDGPAPASSTASVPNRRPPR